MIILRLTFRRTLTLLGLLGLGARSTAHAQQPLVLTRLSGSIELDGVSDEAAWRDVPVLRAVGHTPTFGAEPSERTAFLVAYDDEYLYAAGRMYDADPAGIRATSLKRDENSFSNDWFVLNVDAFADKENLVSFATTPAGLRTDFQAKHDTRTPPRLAWNTFWDVAVKRTGDGWFAEMRIPLSSLRFQEREGRVVMGISLVRYIARKNETISYPAIEPRWGMWSAYKASQAREAVLTGVRARTAVALTPYVLGGAGRDHAQAAEGTSYRVVHEDLREAGLALKYGLTNNLTLDLTYNTDFAQVEADDQEINLTRFSISLPEKRPFFLERASAFEFETGDGGQLFYSRRIGIEDGQRAPILGGARLVGRIGEWDVALLDMQTEAVESPAAGERAEAANFGVVRIRRRVVNDNSYVGAIATGRIADGQAHLALGGDALFRLFGQDYLTVAAATAAGNAAPGSGATLDRGLLRAQWERRGIDGLGYAFELVRIGAEFDPPTGFLRRSGHLATADRISYGWRPGPGSRLQHHAVSLHGSAHRRLEDGVMESAEFGAAWDAELRSGRRFTIEAGTTREDLAAGFALSETVDVPAGAYRFHTIGLTHAAPFGAYFRPNVAVAAGSFYDGWKAAVTLTPTWNVSRHLEVGGVYQVSRIRFPDRAQTLTAHLARVRARAMLSTRVTLSGFAQYNSSNDDAIVNLRLRYNPSEGHDLYLVYDEGLNMLRDGPAPRPPLRDRRTVMLKYSRTFRLELPR